MKNFLFGFLLVFFCVSSSFAYTDDYKYVDRRAKEAPLIYDDDMVGLVNYLIEPYKDDDDKKARVLFAWIIYHVDYNYYKYEIISEILRGKDGKVIKETDIFYTREGVCGDISMLFIRMAKIAKLEVAYVYGYSKRKTDKQFTKAGAHAWNKVKIKGKWVDIDATWAMDGRNVLAFANVSKMKYEREMKKRVEGSKKLNRKARLGRDVDDDWYNIDPELYKKTHLEIKIYNG